MNFGTFTQHYSQEWIESARATNGRVFIHCQRGVSRSTTFAISYLMWHKDATYYATLEDVKSKRSIASPNSGFATQLIAWEKRKSLPTTQPYRLYKVRLERVSAGVFPTEYFIRWLHTHLLTGPSLCPNCVRTTPFLTSRPRTLLNSQFAQSLT